MIEKLKQYRHHPWVKQLRDIRVIGFLVFGAIVLLVSLNTVDVIRTNYELQKQISRLDQQNAVSDLTNTNLKLKNEYFNTDQYLELSARKQFGKGAPGETMLIVPKNVAMTYTAPVPKKEEPSEPAVEASKPSYQRNFEAWVGFFFHRK